MGILTSDNSHCTKEVLIHMMHFAACDKFMESGEFPSSIFTLEVLCCTIIMSRQTLTVARLGFEVRQKVISYGGSAYFWLQNAGPIVRETVTQDFQASELGRVWKRT